jgi:hypothetical protein
VGTHPTSVPGAYITGDFSDSGGGVEFRHTNGTQGIGFGYNTVYATGGNADQDLNLRSRGAGNVKVWGRGTVMVCLEEALRIIRGCVNPPNSVGLGAGYTVTHVNTGVYDINFNTPFNNIPVVVVTQLYPGGDPNASQGGSTLDNSTIVGISTTKARIKTGDGAGNPSDRIFAFIAVGP